MTGRQKEILWRLLEAPGPMTSQQLAEQVGVSVRTIKSEMAILRVELESMGARLISRCNKGYNVAVLDREAFSILGAQLNNQRYFQGEMLDDTTTLLNFLRKLVSVDYTTLEDAADELFTSRSHLQGLMRPAADFLKSYHITIHTRPGAGIKAQGGEQYLRLAMTELYSHYFHKIDMKNPEKAYAQWVRCDNQERQDIRHDFLRVLRESEVTVTDLISQRGSLYLMIARNRWLGGYHITVPEDWKRKIRQTDVYPVAVRVFDVLGEKYSGYQVAEDEVDFFAIYLLCNRDMGHLAPRKKRAPFVYKESLALTTAVLERVREHHNVSLAPFSWMENELQNHLIVMLAKKEFELNGLQYFGSTQELYVYRSPVSVDIARTIISCVEQELGCSLNSADCLHFAYYVYEVLSYLEYNIKKKNLLLTSGSGIAFTKVVEQYLAKRYPRFIKSCTCLALYEIRRLDISKYDAVITDAAFPYNYDLPVEELHIIPGRGDLNKVFSGVLVDGFCYRELLPSPDCVRVYRDFQYLGKEQFFQMLSFKFCTRDEDCTRMQQQLARGEKLFGARPSSGTVVVFGQMPDTHSEAVELYCLQKPGNWSGEKIDYILYVCCDWREDLMRVKAMENATRMLVMDQQYVRALAEDPAHGLEKAVEGLLQIEWL